MSRFSQEQRDRYVQEALAAGMTPEEIEDYLARNPDDYNRLVESRAPTDGRPYDSQTSDPYEQQQNTLYDAGRPAGGTGGGGGGGGGWNIPNFQPFTPPDIDYPEWQAPSWDVGAFVAPTPTTTGPFVAPTPTTGNFVAPSWDVGQVPQIAPFAYDDFVGPTAETFQADPGYDFRLKEGTRAIEHAAAAEGLLRTGGTLKGLMEYGQGLASQEFGNVYNRQFNTWNANRANALDAYTLNRDTAFGGWDRTLAGEQAEFGNALSAWNAGQSFDQNAFNQALTEWTAGQGYDQNAFNQALATWQTRFNAEQAEQQNAMQDYIAQYGAASDEFGRAFQTWQGNNAGALGWFGANLNADNSQWANLLSLYDLATRNLPTYTPIAFDY